MTIKNHETGAACPKCAKRASVVKDSRLNAEGYTRRRRHCICGWRFTTLEVYEKDYNATRKMQKVIEEFKA